MVSKAFHTVFGNWRPESINVMMSSLKLDSRLMMSSITSSIWTKQRQRDCQSSSLGVINEPCVFYEAVIYSRTNSTLPGPNADETTVMK